MRTTVNVQKRLSATIILQTHLKWFFAEWNQKQRQHKPITPIVQVKMSSRLAL